MHINRFMGAHMDDMARKNRFEIEIHGPKGIRSRGIRCKTVSLPGRQIQTSEHSEYPGGPPRAYPVGIDYDSGSSDLKTRKVSPVIRFPPCQKQKKHYSQTPCI